MRQLTRREIVIVAVAVALAAALGLYRFAFAPELAALALLNRQIESQTRQMASVETAADRLPAVRQEHGVVAARLREIERRMPVNISVSTLIGRLSQAIAASGIQLIEVTFPGGTQPSASATGPVQELAYTVRVRGTFGRIITFMRLMEAPPPMAAEQSLNISGGAAGGNQAVLEMTIGMKAFALR